MTKMQEAIREIFDEYGPGGNLSSGDEKDDVRYFHYQVAFRVLLAVREINLPDHAELDPDGNNITGSHAMDRMQVVLNDLGNLIKNTELDGRNSSTS